MDPRPVGMVPSIGNSDFKDELGLSGSPDPGLGRPNEKGQRGKLIMAAERNKKNLEDGTYGKDALHTSEVLGGDGPSKPPLGDLAGLRVAALLDEQGQIKSRDVRGTDATAVYDRRQKRLDATSDGALAAIREGRLNAAGKRNSTLAVSTEAGASKMASNIKTTHTLSVSASKDPSQKASCKTMLVDIRYKRIENAYEMILQASRKRARPSEDAKAEEASAMALSNPDRKDLAAQARDRDRMIKARRRKLLDFCGLKASKSAEPMMTSEALVATTREEAPLGGVTKEGGAKKITEEEKEMLEILRNISSPSAAAQAPVVMEQEIHGNKEKQKRPKIKDTQQKAGIATARMDFLFGAVSS